MARRQRRAQEPARAAFLRAVLEAGLTSRSRTATRRRHRSTPTGPTCGSWSRSTGPTTRGRRRCVADGSRDRLLAETGVTVLRFTEFEVERRARRPRPALQGRMSLSETRKRPSAVSASSPSMCSRAGPSSVHRSRKYAQPVVARLLGAADRLDAVVLARREHERLGAVVLDAAAQVLDSRAPRRRGRAAPRTRRRRRARRRSRAPCTSRRASARASAAAARGGRARAPATRSSRL